MPCSSAARWARREDLEALHRGGYLHDVGKIGVPDAVLLKPGPLTPDEFELMKRHPEIGDSLCAPLQSLRRVRPIVRGHHERIDGSGEVGTHAPRRPGACRRCRSVSVTRSVRRWSARTS